MLVGEIVANPWRYQQAQILYDFDQGTSNHNGVLLLFFLPAECVASLRGAAQIKKQHSIARKPQ